MSEIENDYLVHYGVLGMKWGVRKDKRRSGSSIGSKIKRAVAKRKQQKAQKKKPTNNPKKMSDEELRRRVARLQLEKQYKELSKREISTGEKLFQEILQSGVRNVSKQMSNKVGQLMAKELEDAWKKKKAA